MTTSRVLASWLFVFMLAAEAGTVVGQTGHEPEGPGTVPRIPILITERVDEAKLVTLAGNTRPEVNANNDRGRLADNFPLQHMMLLLRRSSGQEQALEKLIDQLHDSESPDFHHWLTAGQLGETYGLADEDIHTITLWLQSHGFSVNTVYPNQLVIDFSGTAGQVRRTFHTEIHQLNVSGQEHIANMTDPQIPAALAPAIVGVVSLSDFMPRPMYEPRGYLTTGCSGFTCYDVVPADLATIYNLNPLFKAGFSGTGQTIALVEDSDVFSSANWSTFRSVLGLSGYSGGSFTTIHPEPPSGPHNCTDPGANPNDGEAILDAEWASAAAPNAAILMITCADTATTFGGFVALQNLLNDGSAAGVISISYGASETDDGAASNAFINSLYQQAVTEGISVFVSAGDQAAAVSDRDAKFATHGINVNGWASTVYNVAVGGTDFGDTYAGTNSIYWSGTNGTTYGSALSYIPEIPWNDSCASLLIAKFEGFTTTYGTTGFCNSVSGSGFLNVVGGSGGPSACATGAPAAGSPGVVSGTCKGYAKPSWQSVFEVPADGVRDLPDVSLFAANGVWGHSYVYCDSDISNGGTACTTNAPGTWSLAGGTSFSSPIMAGIQSLINQATGQRWGNPNPTYYSLAAAEYGKSGDSSCNSTLGNAVASTCIFYDVTEGDMDVPCQGKVNCYLPSGTYGVLSTSNLVYAPAYGTRVGWDFATGIGTINAYNLEQAFLARSRFYKRNTALGEQVDYFGEGRADFTIWRPSVGTFYGIDGSGRTLAKPWGESTDTPVIGDYDGDGKTDFAVRRPSNATWYILQSSNGKEVVRAWGEAGDIPVPGDYDGDGKTDIAVWRPSTGVWYILQSSNGKEVVRAWGEEGDIPVPGDYDGDGKTDIAVWRRSTGTWYIIQSSNGEEITKAFGESGDVPVPADYDGDGKTDIGIWLPETGTFYIIQSSNGKEVVQQLGQEGDVPVSRDYDGDGKADFAVWYPPTGTWSVIQSSTGKTITERFGAITDIPMNKPVGQ
jgi:Pro-kumamolisin, activation domain/FG-GAP-like repeat